MAEEKFMTLNATGAQGTNIDKSKYDIHSFVPTPVAVKEFFGMLGRFLERRTDRKNSALRKNERNSGAPAMR